MEEENEVTIDIVELFFYLKKKILVIILSIVIFAVAGFFVTKLFITPKYTASTRVYVLNQASETSVASSDFQISTYLFNDYKVLITGQNVTKQVISELGLDITPTALGNMITVTAPESTARVLQISVTDTDPQRAADIANKAQEVASEQLAELMNLDAVKLVYAADVPSEPSSPSVKLNVLLAALLGAVLVVGIYVLVYIFDDTIRTEEDVERYLGVGTLGVIPMAAGLSTGTAKTGKSQPSGSQTNRKK